MWSRVERSPFLSLSHGVWRLDSWNSTLVVLTSPVSEAQDVSFIMDMAQYEYVHMHHDECCKLVTSAFCVLCDVDVDVM